MLQDNQTMQIDQDYDDLLIPISTTTGATSYPSTISVSHPNLSQQIQSQAPLTFDYPSPLTDLDIEEVPGPLASATDNLQTSPGEQDTIQYQEQPRYPEVNIQGYKIRPEEHDEHPDFLKYGRSGGKSQHQKQPVKRAYLSGISDFINQMDNNAPVSELCDSLEALLAEHQRIENEPEVDDAQLGSHELFTLLAGLGRHSKNFSYQEVMCMDDDSRNQAMEATKKEIQQLTDKGMWHEAELPETYEAIPTVLVFTKKFDADGNFVKWKSRCVVQGF